MQTVMTYGVVMVYLMLGVTLFSNITINEYTAGKVVALAAIYTFGLALLVAGHYIVPFIVRRYYWGTGQVVRSRYLIVKRRGAPELVGYVFLKVMPTQPVTEMGKEERERFLGRIEKLLSGTQFEAALVYMVVRDRFRNSMIQTLESMKARLLALSMTRLTPAQQERLQRINEELRILRHSPLTTGIYIAIARVYGRSEQEVIQNLEYAANVLKQELSGISAAAEVLRGEELRNVLDMLMFGNLLQISYT